MSDHESRLSELSLTVSTLKGYWDNDRSLLQKLLQDLPRMKEDLAALGNILSNHQVEVKALAQEFAKLKSLVATIREEFSRNLTIESHSLLKNIEEKHNSIARLSSEHASKIEKFESLIEEISLDSKNAVLKANNADMMVMINKKKLENVQLMMKNNQFH